jgi:hypothetical protein
MNAGILEAMADLYNQKQAEKTGFLESMKDAAAWWSGGAQGPSEALSRRAKDREEQASNLFQIQAQIAQTKAAQESAKRDAASLSAIIDGTTPITGAGGTMINVPDNVKAEMSRHLKDGNVDAAKAAYKKWWDTDVVESTKLRYNPAGLESKYEVKVPDGQGGWTIETVDANEYLRLKSANPNIQAKPVPAATPAAAPSAAVTDNKAAPVSVRNNNPGNLVDPKTGEIRKFATIEEGQAALDADLQGKLNGTSQAYKSRFGDAPVSPSTLAETWAPSTAKGNSAESTANYAKYIADKLGIAVTDPIPNTPEARAAVKQAITEFEAGPGSGAKPTATAAAAPSTAPTAATPAAAPSAPAAAPKVTPAATLTGQTTTAPTAAPAARVPTMPELRAAAKVREEKELAEAKTAGTKLAEEADKVSAAGASADTRIVDADRIYTLARDNPRMVGQFAKPGLISMAGIGLKEGIKVGTHGQIALPSIEEMTAVMTKGVTGPELQARKDLIQTLHKVELDLSSLLKGQGSVSDAERRILAGVAGSVSDPADLLMKKATLLKMHAEYDKEMEKAHRLSGMSWGAFKRSGEYDRIKDGYAARLKENFNKEYQNGRDIPVESAPVGTSRKKAEKPSSLTYEDQEKEKRYQEWKKSQGSK